MKTFLIIAGTLSIILGLLAAGAIASDIQLILAAVLINGGIIMLGIANAIGKLNKESM